MKIHKTELQITGLQKVTLPVGHQILSLHIQNDLPCIWYTVPDGEEKLEIVTFLTITTGVTYKPKDNTRRDFIGTYLLNDGKFVGHIFKEKQL